MVSRRPPIPGRIIPILLRSSDINECSMRMAACLPSATCVNTIGSYMCICPAGQKGDGMTSCATAAADDAQPIDGEIAPSTYFRQPGKIHTFQFNARKTAWRCCWQTGRISMGESSWKTRAPIRNAANSTTVLRGPSTSLQFFSPVATFRWRIMYLFRNTESRHSESSFGVLEHILDSGCGTKASNLCHSWWWSLQTALYLPCWRDIVNESLQCQVSCTTS